jgi:hypothetical protein
MSVELTLYVGEISHGRWSGDIPFMIQKLAALKIVAFKYDSAIYNLKPLECDPAIFMYADDGKTRIYQDNYGSDLRALSLDRVIEALEADAGDCTWQLDCVRGIRQWYADTSCDIQAVLYFH